VRGQRVHRAAGQTRARSTRSHDDLLADPHRRFAQPDYVKGAAAVNPEYWVGLRLHSPWLLAARRVRAEHATQLAARISVKAGRRSTVPATDEIRHLGRVFKACRREELRFLYTISADARISIAGQRPRSLIDEREQERWLQH